MNSNSIVRLFMMTAFLLFLSWPAALGGDALPQENANLSLNGTAFLDENHDGLLTAGDPTVPGLLVRLILNGTEIRNATTGELGAYEFSGLSAGRYLVKADSLSGAVLFTPGRGFYEVTLSDLPAFGLDFGLLLTENASKPTPPREYPIMHLSPEEMSAVFESYNETAQTYLSPGPQAGELEAAPKNHSLLGLLNYTASERDQGTCGNCWAWAGTGVMEIDYARQKGISDRLSIQYLDSNYNGGWGKNGACCGGWLEYLASFYQSKKIMVPWSNANAHYRDAALRCGGRSPSASTISTDPHYDLATISATTIPARGIAKEKAIANIKNVLLQNKAIWFGFFLPDSAGWNDFYNFWGSEQESAVWQPDQACGRAYSYSTGGGHAVLCVGYNDTDPTNRTWLMLNSWGTTPERDRGLFLVDMDMDYNCSCPGLGYAFYWMTLNMNYDVIVNHPPGTPTKPVGPAGGAAANSLTYNTTSTDPDGDPVRVTFDWGDGTTTQTAPTTSGKFSSSHAWSAKGNYTIKAQAADSKGAKSAWSDGLLISITKANQPPSRPSSPTGPSSGSIGTGYKFESRSTDPDGDDVRLIFDWGDSSQTTTGFFLSGKSINATHAWAKSGTFSIRAMAEDTKGGRSGWSAYQRIKIAKQVNLPPKNPTPPAGVSKGFTGRSYAFVGYSTDPNRDRISYTFDWGDGEITTTPFATSGVSVRATHTWGGPGAYDVSIMATDSNGEQSGWSLNRRVVIDNYVSPTVLESIRAAVEARRG